jgi:hypothetical protein
MLDEPDVYVVTGEPIYGNPDVLTIDNQSLSTTSLGVNAA